MRRMLFLAGGISVAVFLSGCETIPPGAERGPDGTMAYTILVEATPPGAEIEVNGEMLGETPLNVKVFGDPDGTFHDFGSSYFVVRALPLTTNQYVQTRAFGTGQWFGPEDEIPNRIYFDMNQNVQYVPTPVYVYPDYGPPIYFGPHYYHWGHRHHYGGGIRLHPGHIVPPHHRHWRRW